MDEEAARATAPDGEAGLSRRAARAALSAFSGQGAMALLQILSVVVLARLLTPSDFGLYAMVFSVIGIAHLFRDLGLSAAAIQAPQLSHQQQSNLFWVNTGLGALGALACLALAPLLGAFYDNPAVVPIASALACTFIMSGAVTQWRAGLVRQMRFGRVAVADIAAAVLGFGSGIVGALLGWGAWALVAQQVVGGFFALVFLGFAAGWLPRPYRRFERMSELYRFGGTMFVTQVLTYVAAESGSIILGRQFGPYSVGLFNRAVQTVRTSINQIRTPLWQVAFTTLAKIQNDDARFMRFMARGQLVVCIPILAVTGGVAAASAPFTEVVLGSQWAAAAPFVALIAIGEGVDSLASIAYWIFTARGLGRQLLQLTVVTVAVRVLALIAGSTFGPIGVAAAFAATPILLFPVSLWWAGRAAGLRTGVLIARAYELLALALLPSALTALTVHFVGASLHAAVALFIAIGVQLVGFALLAALPRIRSAYREMWDTLSRVRRPRPAGAPGVE